MFLALPSLTTPDPSLVVTNGSHAYADDADSVNVSSGHCGFRFGMDRPACIV